MKKIINGRRYDTDTARKAATAYPSNNWNPRDFNYCREDLYCKQTGEFFLHGEGGPMSKYAEECGQNQWTGGAKLIPLSFEAAQKWAEQYLTGDEYERIFGEVDEAGERAPVTLKLNAAAVKKLALLAARDNIQKSEVVERLLEQA